ncbi:MAG: 30S ribosome-binding factor RbfA [Myxococcota bacterium]|nr:30S ribosome-binding factor RbfA [Myxococcota bacterium]MDW8363002.1 30S ribosome-binding factor RbfA [Myxococcales bacterium]
MKPERQPLPAHVAETRTVRVANRIREELATLLMRGELAHPAVEGIVVTRVEMNADLSVARVGVRLLDAVPSERRRQRAVQVLAARAPHLARRIGRLLRLRRIPELRIVWDGGMDHAMRVEALLDELRSEGRRGAS